MSSRKEARQKKHGKQQEQQPKKYTDGRPGQGIHAFVATPAYDGRVLTDYAISLAESCQIATVWGIQVTACVMSNGAFIDLARNTLVRLFLESPATHLFFIDADLKWEPRAFVSLLMSGQPVVAGVYPKRQDPEEYPIAPWDHPEVGGLWVDNDWVMCKRVPTGFLCIERSVIERMAAKAMKLKLKGEPPTARLFYTYINEDGGFVGEDFAWCDDYVREFGKPIPVWPDFEFTHGVRWKGNWAKHLSQMCAEEEAAEKAQTDAVAEIVKEAA